VEPDRVDRLVADVVALFPAVDAEAKSLGARLLHLSDLTQQHYNAVCERLGISLSGHSVLTTLRRHAPRQLTLTEINRDALVTSGGMTFVVGKLEEAGYVQRVAHPTDRRAVLLRLTPEGRRMADKVVVAMAEADKSIAGHIRGRDRPPVVRTMHKIQLAVERVSEVVPQLADATTGARSRSRAEARSRTQTATKSGARGHAPGAVPRTP